LVVLIKTNPGTIEVIETPCPRLDHLNQIRDCVLVVSALVSSVGYRCCFLLVECVSVCECVFVPSWGELHYPHSTG